MRMMVETWMRRREGTQEMVKRRWRWGWTRLAWRTNLQSPCGPQMPRLSAFADKKLFLSRRTPCLFHHDEVGYRSTHMISIIACTINVTIYHHFLPVT